MGKRQEINKPLSKFLIGVVLYTLLLVASAACQGNAVIPENELYRPKLTKLNTEKALTPEPTKTISPDVLPTGTATTSPIGLSRLTPSAELISNCLFEGGEVHDHSFFSDHLGEDFHFKVYLPSCYHINQNQHYPTIYLLHGLINNADQWIRIGVADKMDILIATNQIAPFIIILPNEARFLPPQTSAFAEVITAELIPWVDEHYRTLPGRTNRAIGGLSRGAAWSVRIGFTHYKLFASIGAHSLALFEADGNKLPAWLSNISPDDYPEVYIDIGRGDKERQSAQTFADALNENSVPHSWFLFNGSHTEEYWSAHLEDYLRWYARDW